MRMASWLLAEPTATTPSSYINLLVPFRLRQRRLRSRQPGHRHAEGRAAHVRQPDLVEERHAVGVATVLTADAQLDVWVGRAALLDGHPHQRAHAIAVNRLERV